MTLLSRAVEPNNLRLLFAAGGLTADLAREIGEDARFAARLSRGLLSRARNRRVPVPDDLFPAARPIAVPQLAGKRLGLVASGGSGALASLCGVKRAFEEAGLEVAAISACSGAALFASLWAAGYDADQMARFWLSVRGRDYVDPDWRALGRAALRRFRDFGGLLRGEAIEATFRARFGDLCLGDLDIPLFIPAWNTNHNRFVYFGTTTTPNMPLAKAVRVAISIPIFVEPVAHLGQLYGDGGIVSIFPARPLADFTPPLDFFFGVNCYFPEDFDGEHIGAWRERSFAILRASGQLRTCVSLELAREQVRLLGSRLELLHPVPYWEIAGARFYEQFLDRARWPEFMRMGHRSTRKALERIGRGARARPDGLAQLTS
jgi:NTE family protein